MAPHEKEFVALDIKDDAVEKKEKPRLVPADSSSVDDDLLQRAIHDAGRWAYGTIYVEVWVSKGTSLFRPDGGYWLDPMFHQNCKGEKENNTCAVCRLTDESVDNYCPAKKVAIGEGIAGSLFTELSTPVLPRNGRQASDSRKIIWKNVQSMLDDPDQPYNERLEVIAEAGIGLAASVGFRIGGQEGLVAYMARATTNVQKLRSPSNEAYLKSAADLIGAAWAMRGPRQTAVQERMMERDAAIRRMRTKLIALSRLGIGLKRHVHKIESQKIEVEQVVSVELTEEPTNRCPEFLKEFALATKTKVIVTLKKMKGPGVQPPPAFDWRQALWSFVGALLTLLILTKLNEYLTETYGSDHSIVLGPFGALMTLQYGLTAAPASQPMNAIMGQAISLSIALGIGYLDDLDVFLRQSLGTSLSIFCMVKFGFTHPPAGAAALLFSDGSKGWIQMGMMLLGNAIAIFCASVINNLNSKRQYPTSYGIVWWWRKVWPEKRDDDSKKKIS